MMSLIPMPVSVYDLLSANSMESYIFAAEEVR